MNEVTQLLLAIKQGDRQATEQLLPIIYDELRALASLKMANEKPGQTLQATALVHEVYLRLVGNAQGQQWDSRGHFFSAAAEAMKRILVETARRKRRVKHGGKHPHVPIPGEDIVEPPPSDDLIALDEALENFSKEEPVKAELVQLRFFAGLSLEEAATALGISRATASRYWAYARAWLYDAITKDDDTVKGSEKKPMK